MTAKVLAYIRGILLVFLIIFTPLASGTVGIGAVTILHVATVSIMALWALSMIHNRQVDIYRTPADVPGLFFLVLALLSVMFSVYRYASVIQIYRIVNYGAIFFLVVQMVQKRDRLIQLAWLITLFGSAYATTSLVSNGADLPVLESLSTARYNLSMTFVNHNHYAGYLELTTWLGVGLALGYRGAKRALLLALSVYMAVAVLFSLSRGGSLALTGGFLFYSLVLLRFKYKRQLFRVSLFAALVVFMVAWLGPGPVMGQLSSLEDPLSAGKVRLSIWRGTLDMIEARPWLGWGLGSYIYAYPRFQTEDTAQWIINRAHNDYLELAAEMGLPGLLSFLLAVIVVYRFCLRKKLAQRDRLLQSIGLGALSGCFSLLVHGVTDSNLHIPSNAFLFVILLAIAICSTHFATDGQSTLHHFQLYLPRRWATALCLAVVSIGSLAMMRAAAPYVASRYFMQARTHEANEHYELAHRALRRAITLDSGRAKTLEVAANLTVSMALQSTDTNVQREIILEALQYNDRAISACSTRGSAYQQRASILQKLHRHEELGDALRKLVELWPMRASAHYALGKFQLDHGNHEGAQVAYRRSIQLDERYLRPILDQLWGSSPSYDHLRLFLPESANAKKGFADFLYNKSLNHAAVTELGHALELEPSEDRTLDYLRGLCHVKNFDAALDIGRRLLQEYEDVHLLLEVIAIHPIFNRLPKAASIYTNPRSARSYLVLASKHRQENSPTEAVDVLQEALDRYPQNASLHYHMFLTMRQLENRQNVFRYLKKAISLDPENSAYCHLLGGEYLQSKLRQLAVQQWEKCLRMNSEDQASARAIESMLPEVSLSDQHHTFVDFGRLEMSINKD